MEKLLLRFTRGNAKLSDEIHVFSLPAGHTCPGARLCLAKADPDTGKITDGKHAEFRCYAASEECTYGSVRLHRWHNYMTILKACREEGQEGPTKFDAQKIRKLIENSLPPGLTHLRIHTSGDFFHQAYFDAWLEVAQRRPDAVFYAYTKSLRFWANRLADIPANFRLTASRGGAFDSLIEKLGLPEVVVVFHPKDALAMHLEIDHDDSHAMAPDREKFALLLHGVQPAGSEAARAKRQLAAEGIKSGYSKKDRPKHVPLDKELLYAGVLD